MRMSWFLVRVVGIFCLFGVKVSVGLGDVGDGSGEGGDYGGRDVVL